MKTAFRVDASLRIGSGHVMRCLTLARELDARGGKVVFLCRESEGNLSGMISENYGFEVRRLVGPASADRWESPPAHHHWLETHWEPDARDASAALDERFDWLVVDHYALDQRWETRLREKAERILVIDDLADRKHLCDALLDQNIQAGGAVRYSGLVPPGARLLLGPGFALLRPEFVSIRARMGVRNGSIRKILVFFGGIDLHNETEKTLQALDGISSRNLEVTVVLGVANPWKEAVRRHCRKSSYSLLVQVDDMAGLMASSDLAVGACGTSTWERACLGLPSLCVSIAENQDSIGRMAGEKGLIQYLGESSNVDAGVIRGALEQALSNSTGMAAMTARCLEAVDGKGAARVADFMEGERVLS